MGSQSPHPGPREKRKDRGWGILPVFAQKTREKWARGYCPDGFSAGLAEGFFDSDIAALGFQNSGSALIHSSEV